MKHIFYMSFFHVLECPPFNFADPWLPTHIVSAQPFSSCFFSDFTIIGIKG